MLSSAALGTAVGLTMLFAVTALLCSGVTEAASNFMQLRARYLLTGLRAMLDAPEAGAPGSGPSQPAARSTKAAKKKLHNDTRRSSETRPARQEVRDIVNGKVRGLSGANTFTLALFDSPLIKCLQSRKVLTGQLRNPQYISSTTFVRALVDTLLPDGAEPAPPATTPTTPTFVRSVIDTLLPNAGNPAQPAGTGSVLTELSKASDKLPDGQLKTSLRAFITQSEGDLEKFESSLENWYDDQMARISGWYKRWSRVFLGVVGLIAAVLINIDAVQVAHTLYVDAPVRQAVSTAADSGALCQGETSTAARASCVQQELAQLRAGGLPLGYPSGCTLIHHPPHCWKWSPDSPKHGRDLPLKILGWIVTAFAVSFGAPFWFDALSKLGSLRSAGAKPAASTAGR